MRVTVLGSDNPWVTRGQASASILVEANIFPVEVWQPLQNREQIPDLTSYLLFLGVCHILTTIIVSSIE